MEKLNRTAKIAGYIYLVVIITGMFSLAYIPHTLINWKNGRETFVNLSQSAFLFRFGIYCSVICYVAFTFLVLTLFKLLKTVNRYHAITMAVLALLSVPFSLANLQHHYTAAAFTGKESMLQTPAATDLQNKLMLALLQYNDGILLATVFWGLWLLPFGWLVYRSGYIPRYAGVLLMLGCAGHLINFTGNTLFENYAASGTGKLLGLLPALAEINICVYLMFIPLKPRLHEK